MWFKTQMKTKLGWCLVFLAFPWLLAAAPRDVEPCDPAVTCFEARLTPDNLLGDFYLDGALVVAGVNSVRITATPGLEHQIDVRNIQDPNTPGFNNSFNYPDQSAVQKANGGWVWRVGFYPQKNYIKGTLQYVCQPYGHKPTDVVVCRLTLDGVVQPDIPAGGSAAYVLPGGVHTLHTDLLGDQATNWSTTTRDDSVTVVNGRTNWFIANFVLKGMLKIIVPAGLTADLYLDGVLLAPQSKGFDVFVTPQVAHLIEAKNVVDPAANGRYRYDNATQSAIVYTGGTRNVNVNPPKVWLTGTLSFFCLIYGRTLSDDVQCLVSVDGTQVGTVPPSTRMSFSLPVGTHTVTVSTTGGSSGKWDGPVNTSLKIRGGWLAYYTGRFNLRPTVITVSVPPTSQPSQPQSPPPIIISGGGGTPGGFELGGQVNGFSSPDRMKYAGMMWVKRQARWGPGAVADAGAINDAHAKGFKILLSVIGENPNVIAGGTGYDSYAAYVGELARMGADAIEVWNEMNLDREWPVGEIDPGRYTDLLRRSYSQIKSKNPNTIVISGAPAPTGAEGAFGRAHVWNDNSFIAGMAAAGAANYMDCVGVHYNEGIISPTWTSGDPRDPYYTRYYSGMVTTYFNAFGGRKKLCFTELGYLSPEGYGSLPGSFGWAGNTSAGEQAQWLAEAVSLARSSSNVRMIILFNVDFTGWGDDPQGGYAIIRPGGGCPACDMIRAVTGGR
jgi:hypothetical protein